MSFHDHRNPPDPAGSRGQIVAIGEDIVGILQVDRQGSRLRVLDPRFDILDGSRFASMEQAQAAVETLRHIVGGDKIRP